MVSFSEAGEGGYTGDVVLVGKPYELPFTEQFAPTGMQTAPWSTMELGSSYYRAWTYVSEQAAKKVNPKVSAQDGNGGLAMFYQTQVPVYEERLISPRITKAGKNKVAAVFYVYHDKNLDEQYAKTNYVMIEAQIGTEYIQMSKPIYINDGEHDGWTEHKISLDGLNVDEFRLSLRASSAVAQPIFFDNLVVKDGVDGAETFVNLVPAHIEGIRDEASGNYYVTWTEPNHLTNISVVGYNVFCNNVKLNAEPFKGTWYQVDEPNPKDEYYVTVVYDKGESEKSNIVLGEKFTDGIADAIGEEAVCNAFAVKGGIILEGNDAGFQIYTLNGALVAQGRVFGTEQISVENGIYIVRVGGKVVKCMVR